MNRRFVFSFLTLAILSISSQAQVIRLGKSTTINNFHDGVIIGQVETTVKGVQGFYGFTKRLGQPMKTFTFSQGVTTGLIDQREVMGKGECSLGTFTSPTSFGIDGFLACAKKTVTYDFGTNYTIPRALLKNGTVAGYFDFFLKDRAFIIDSNGFRTYLVPGSVQTDIFTATEDGRFAGRYMNADGKWHGFILAADGTVTTVDKPGAVDSAVVSLNSTCTLGFFDEGLFTTPQNAFLHCPKRGYPPIPLGDTTWPTVLQEDGTIAGSFILQGESVGFIWKGIEEQ